MKINKIKKAKNNKYEIHIDDEIINIYDNVILDNELLYKKNIDMKEYKKIIEDNNFYEIYYKILKIVMKKRKTEKEIIEYLNKFNLSNDNINKIILKLKDLKLIDDRQYCKSYINDKIYLSKYGINKIKQDLIEKEIPINIIYDELNKIDKNIVNANIEKLIIKKIKLNNKYSNSYIKQKVLNEMINIGYDKNEVEEILNKIEVNDYNILDKEFDKIYNKLSVKYKGIELKNKVVQKLLLKGFSYSDINILLEQKTED